MSYRAGLFGGFLAFLCSSASAATVSGAQGTLLVNTGQGFTQVALGTDLAPGTRVLLNPIAGGQGATAQLSYPSTCVIWFPTPGLYTVPTEEQCLASQNSPTNTFSDAPFNMAPGNVALGAALIGGAVVGIIQLTKDNSASP